MKVSDEDFIEAVSKNYSVRATLKALGLCMTGGSYPSFRKRVKNLGISIEHFTGSGHLKNKTHSYNKGLAINDILVENSNYSRGSLKRRLIKEKLLEYKCSNCGIESWDNKTISLHLDHINGINDDNRLHNLRLLCPNCHSQTDTFAGKNIAKKNEENGYIREPKNKSLFKIKCQDCDKKVYGKSIRCNMCNKITISKNKLENFKNYIDDFYYQYLKDLLITNVEDARSVIKLFRSPKRKYSPRINKRKIERPTKEILEKLVWQKSTSQIARDFNVSDNAIAKWCKIYGITKPERGYWAKLAAGKI